MNKYDEIEGTSDLNIISTQGPRKDFELTGSKFL